MDKTEIVDLKNKLKKLSFGVDPTTDIKIPDDSALNKLENKELFHTVAIILDKIINNEFVGNNKSKKHHFFLTADQIKSLKLSEKPIPISEFVHYLNSIKNNERIRKLKASDVTSWLASQGYLSDILYYNGCYCRELTEKSKELGLSLVKKKDKNKNEYNIILYSYESQKFIVEHLSEITNIL